VSTIGRPSMLPAAEDPLFADPVTWPPLNVLFSRASELWG